MCCLNWGYTSVTPFFSMTFTVDLRHLGWKLWPCLVTWTVLPIMGKSREIVEPWYAEIMGLLEFSTWKRHSVTIQEKGYNSLCILCCVLRKQPCDSETYGVLAHHAECIFCRKILHVWKHWLRDKKMLAAWTWPLLAGWGKVVTQKYISSCGQV